MLIPNDRQTILEIVAKYRVRRVVLFGPSLSDRESSDIDIGVEGIEGKDFFPFYGELLCALSKPVDVVGLSAGTRFGELVEQEGVPFHT